MVKDKYEDNISVCSNLSISNIFTVLIVFIYTLMNCIIDIVSYISELQKFYLITNSVHVRGLYYTACLVNWFLLSKISLQVDYYTLKQQFADFLSFVKIPCLFSKSMWMLILIFLSPWFNIKIFRLYLKISILYFVKGIFISSPSSKDFYQTRGKHIDFQAPCLWKNWNL